MADFSFNLDDIMSDENHVYFEINDAEMLSIMDKLDKEIENNIKEEPPAAPVGPPSEFASVTEEEMDNIELGKNEKTTLSNTSWGVRRLKAWCKARGRSEEFELLPADDLGQLLRQFYAEARKKDGDVYSKNGLCGLRSAIHRHITSPPYHRRICIMQDKEFQGANNVLIGLLKTMKHEGKNRSKSHPPITPEDLQKLIASDVVGMTTPMQLQKLVWFSLQFFLCRRGGEGSKELRSDSFDIKRDSVGREYAMLKYNESSKNHPGGFKDTNDPQKKMYSNGSLKCPVAALKKYLEKLSKDSKVFYQRPLCAALETDEVWYTGLPVGVNKMGKMMAVLSSEAELSQRYTNHSIRSTAITSLVNRGFDPITISRLSGHRNPASVSSYCADTSEQKKREMADALSSEFTSNTMQQQQEAPASSRESVSTPSAPLQIESPAASLPVPVMPLALPVPPATCGSIAIQNNSMMLPGHLFSNCQGVHVGSINIYQPLLGPRYMNS